MNFSKALDLLKKGKHVARKGWNGKGMWLRLVNASEWSMPVELNGTLTTEPWIGMCTAAQGFIPWLASQTDLLASDWEQVSR